MEIISRKEAIERGEKFYYTGVMCQSGHDAQRFVRDGKCRECNRIACENRFLRKRDRTPGAWDTYWAEQERRQEARYHRSLARTRRERESSARKEAMINGDKQYLSATICPKGHIGYRYTSSASCAKCMHDFMSSEERKEYDRKYADENADAIKARSSAYLERNRARIYAAQRAWEKKNPEKVKATKHNYKIKRRAKESSGISTRELSDWACSQAKVCYWCLTKCENEYHIDHYVPLAKGGKHEIDNLVIACPTCNMRKNAKDPYEYANSLGRLF